LKKNHPDFFACPIHILSKNIKLHFNFHYEADVKPLSNSISKCFRNIRSGEWMKQPLSLTQMFYQHGSLSWFVSEGFRKYWKYLCI